MSDPRKAELVDQLFELREKASGARKIAEDYKTQAEHAELELIQILETEGCSAASGESGTVTITMNAKPKMADWIALKNHIMANPDQRIDLLEKRLSKSGCRERWQAGEIVPGVEQEQETTLAYRALKTEKVPA